MRVTLSIAATLALAVTALAPARADETTDKEIQAIVDKAIEAHGGADNLGKCKATTTKSKGKVHVQAMEIDFTSTYITQQPNQTWLEVTVEVAGQSFTFLQGFDTDKGWKKFMDKVTDMDKDALKEAREQMYSQSLVRLLPLKGKDVTLKPLGDAKVGEQEAVGILVTKKDHRDVSLYFAKKTGLLIKSETRAVDTDKGNEEFAAETIFSNFKEIDGVKHPMKMTIKRDGKLFMEMEHSEIIPSEKVDAATFAKPKD